MKAGRIIRYIIAMDVRNLPLSLPAWCVLDIGKICAHICKETDNNISVDILDGCVCRVCSSLEFTSGRSLSNRVSPITSKLECIVYTVAYIVSATCNKTRVLVSSSNSLSIITQL